MVVKKGFRMCPLGGPAFCGRPVPENTRRFAAGRCRKIPGKIPGSGFLIFSNEIQPEPGLGSGIWDLRSGIWDLGPGIIWDLGSEIWDLGDDSGIWDLRSEI